MTGAVFGLAASLITLGGLWEAAGAGPPPPPPAVMENEEGAKEKNEAKEMVAKPHELDASTAGTGSSYVEVEAVQA